MERFDFTILRGSAPTLRFRFADPTPVTDWETVLYINDKVTDALVFSANGALADANTVPDAESLGVFDVSLGVDDTLSFAPTSFHYSFWRLDLPDPLVSGTVFLKTVL